MNQTADSQAARHAMDRVFREEHGQLVAALIRRFGDVDLAEESASEAVVAALKTWTNDGVPPNPGAWLMTTAKNRAIDYIRREAQRAEKHREATMIRETTAAESLGVIDDDRLRLIFTCCHPVVAQEASVALTLRLLGGLTVSEIAQAFLVADTTMGQRVTRAKKKIAEAQVPFHLPEADDLPARLDRVLSVLFLIFNEGYLSSGDGPAIRAELSEEAMRLARLVHTLMPNTYEPKGLLALMLLTEARRDTRIRDGMLVTLSDQDRSRWNQKLIREGHTLVRECLRHNQPGRYQILAAINAVHTDAQTAADTDWTQILALYDQLLRFDRSPIVQLNRAVAVAEVHGPAVALAIIADLPLSGYHAFHVARADLLCRLERNAEALQAYEAAISTTSNTAERAYLADQRDNLQ